MGNIRKTIRASLVRRLELLSVEDTIPVLFKLGINIPIKVRVVRLFITMAIWPPLHLMEENGSYSTVYSKYCNVFTKTLYSER